MKRKLRYVSSAEGEGDSKLSAVLDELKDDFDYILAGLEKFDRTGAEASNNGLIIAERLQSELQDIISEIGNNVSE